MAYSTDPKIKVIDSSHILYDARFVSDPATGLFSVEQLAGKGDLVKTVGGRGSSSIVRLQDRTWVLRHYRRGGLVGKVLNDQYLGFSRQGSRSWREWHLLHTLAQEEFPVPRPVAAAVHFSCGFYRADLITQYIPETKTLAQLLTETDLDHTAWQDIGRCIARFHRRGVCHADLNAHNILIDHKGAVFLLDFDRGRIRDDGSWCEANLKRLLRSLNKIEADENSFHFGMKNWQRLLEGYRNG